MRIAYVADAIVGTVTALQGSGEISFRGEIVVSDDAKKKNETEEKSPEKKGGLMKMLMLAVITIALIGVAAFGTIFLMGDSSEPVANESAADASVTESTESTSSDSEPVVLDSTDKSNHSEEEHSEITEDDLPEGLFDNEDPSVIEAIMENLAMLDYEPSDDELIEGDVEANRKDSVKKVVWFEKEQNRLDKWEQELETRNRQLDKLNREVSRKVVVIEQAESARVASLAKLYDGMDPRSVAKLMANLDDGTVVSILPRMKTKNASQVLALFPAKRGARLSKQMITIAEK